MNLVKSRNVFRLLQVLSQIFLCSAGSGFIFRTHRGTQCYSHKMEKPVAPSHRSTRRQRAKREDKEEIGRFTIDPQGMDNNDERLVQRHNLLQDWIHHDCAFFHHFSPKEAAAIRKELLIWYKSNRRKLPWRGDPPPYDGSTAGITIKRSDKTKCSINEGVKDETQSSITKFFSTTATTRPTKKSLGLSSAFALSTACQGTKRQVAMEEEEKDNRREDDSPSLAWPQKQPTPVSPYGVWVSEIMLQQTRVEAVIPYWIKCKPLVLACITDYSSLFSGRVNLVRIHRAPLLFPYLIHLTSM
jgi:hypothetical protein